MDPVTMALFRELADRSPSERELYYEQHRVPDAVRADVESLLRFDDADHSLDRDIAAAAEEALLAHSRSQSAITSGPPTTFSGTARFAVLRQLGAGAFGTVYQVWDREQQVAVAVKVLHERKPDLLFRFKREFRALIDVRHHNLVRLYELFSDTDQWFFSMELVDGETFLEHVRPAGRCDLDRLRTALAQLTEGIQALHAAQRLHCDLKPANALVADSGRVVVLDFSLVQELDVVGRHASTEIAGTPAYMAPEQHAGEPVSEATDWYAVGVMLFQALTGTLPRIAFSRRLWLEESRGEPADPRAIDPRVPDDLAALCRQLLNREPKARPDGASMLSALGGAAAVAAGHRSLDIHNDHEPFVGRSDHLRQLEAAFADTRAGRLNVVSLKGPSGIGKTALVTKFLADLADRTRDPIVLKGRCYEFESVPYKGLDALADDCSRYLQSLPESVVEELLPPDASLLPKLFPVLARVGPIASAPARSTDDSDVQELRQRTFRALRDLFARLSHRQPLVIWIDDMQWGDRDSSTFFGELCAPPEPPPLLLLLTYRSEELPSNATLTYLHYVLANQRILGTWHDMTLGELSEPESRELLRHLLADDGQVDADARTTLVHEAEGHPLFLQQLARVARDAPKASERTTRASLTLRTVLQDRVGDLPAFAREVLELACLAAQPLTPAILFAAAEPGDAEHRAEALALLVRERLARSAGVGGGVHAMRRVEPFHDQVRTAVVALLASDVRVARHARLADILARQPDIEPQILVTHYREAGNRRAAFVAAVEAARSADRQLAFDQAATFYRTALDTGDLEPPERAPLQRKLADALALAGRGRDAAHAYLTAADQSRDDNPFEIVDLTRRAAEQLMISGNTEEGLAAIRTVLRAVNLRFPETSRQALMSLAFRRLRVLVRGLTFKERPESQLSDAERILIDTCWSAAIGLSMVDTIRGADFQSRHLLLALDAGEPFRVARALAMEIGHRGVPGRRVEAKTKQLLETASAVSKRLTNPYPSALIAVGSAVLSWLNGRWNLCLLRADEAQRILTEQCASPSWETVTSQIFSMGALVRLGDLNEHRRRMPALLRSAHERGNRYAQISLPLLSYGHVTTLADDEPERAAETVHQLAGAWKTKRYDLQRFWATYASAEIHLYRGDGANAWREIESNRRNVRDSLLLRVQTIRICWLDLSARCALAAAVCGRADLWSRARRLADRMDREGAEWARGFTAVVRAAVLAHDRRLHDAAALLDRAERDFAEADMKLHAAAVREIRRIRGGGPAESGATDRVLAEEGVVQPSRMASMLVPGPWAS